MSASTLVSNIRRDLAEKIAAATRAGLRANGRGVLIRPALLIDDAG